MCLFIIIIIILFYFFAVYWQDNMEGQITQN